MILGNVGEKCSRRVYYQMYENQALEVRGRFGCIRCALPQVVRPWLAFVFSKNTSCSILLR